MSTCLTSPFVPSSATLGGRGQIVKITLTLTYIGKATRSYEWAKHPDTIVCFSVAHSYVDASGVLSTAPRADVRGRICEIRTLPEAKAKEKRVLAEADFVLASPDAVCDRADTPAESCDKRLLRIALECPPDSVCKSTRDLNNITYLLLSVELSD